MMSKIRIRLRQYISCITNNNVSQSERDPRCHAENCIFSKVIWFVNVVCFVFSLVFSPPLLVLCVLVGFFFITSKTIWISQLPIRMLSVFTVCWFESHLTINFGLSVCARLQCIRIGFNHSNVMTTKHRPFRISVVRTTTKPTTIKTIAYHPTSQGRRLPFNKTYWHANGARTHIEHNKNTNI